MYQDKYACRGINFESDDKLVHILIVPSWYPAYAGDINGNFFREQSLALYEFGHQVGVVDVKFRLPKSLSTYTDGTFGYKSENDEGLTTFRYCGFDWFRRISGLRRRLWLYYGMRVFEKYVSKNGMPDVIHAHAIFNGGILAKNIKDQYGVPFVVTEHASAFARGLTSKAEIMVARSIAKAADWRLAVSREFCRLLKQELGTAKLGWKEMPNVVSQMFFEATISKGGARGEPFVFLCIAHLTKNKAVDNLVTAFAQRFEGDSSVKLRIGGDGTEMNYLVAMAQGMGISDQVEFLGSLNRKQVLNEMSKASVFVLPSLYETFGVVVIEALALGRPVIATQCGGPESIVREKDGLLVPTDDVPALAAAMEEIYMNYSSYDAEEIRAACIERFSEPVIAERLTKVYLEVVGVHSGNLG